MFGSPDVHRTQAEKIVRVAELSFYLHESLIDRFGDTAHTAQLKRDEKKKFRKQHRVLSKEHGVIVWLGVPDNTDNQDLKFLDTLFDGAMSAEQKETVLQNEYGIRATTGIRKDLDMMGTFSAAVRQATTEKVTKEVTEKVTKEVTEKVTKEITEKVTDRVTREWGERLLRNPVQTIAEMLVSAGTPAEEIVTALAEHWPQMPAADIERIVSDAQQA